MEAVTKALARAIPEPVFNAGFEGASRDPKLARAIADAVIADLSRPVPDAGRGVPDAIRKAMADAGYVIMRADRVLVTLLARALPQTAREAGFRG